MSLTRRNFIKASVSAATLAALPEALAATQPVAPPSWPFWQDVQGTIPALKTGDPIGLWKGECWNGERTVGLIQPEANSRPTLCFDEAGAPMVGYADECDWTTSRLVLLPEAGDTDNAEDGHDDQA